MQEKLEKFTSYLSMPPSLNQSLTKNQMWIIQLICLCESVLYFVCNLKRDESASNCNSWKKVNNHIGHFASGFLVTDWLKSYQNDIKSVLSSELGATQAQREVVKMKNFDFSYWAWSRPWGHVLSLKSFFFKILS